MLIEGLLLLVCKCMKALAVSFQCKIATLLRQFDVQILDIFVKKIKLNLKTRY